jgi:hypothetical protein
MTGQLTNVTGDGEPFNGVRREQPAWTSDAIRGGMP